LHEQRLSEPKNWRGDGIIVYRDDPHVAAQVSASGIPAEAFGSGHDWDDPKWDIARVFGTMNVYCSENLGSRE